MRDRFRLSIRITTKLIITSSKITSQKMSVYNVHFFLYVDTFLPNEFFNIKNAVKTIIDFNRQCVHSYHLWVIQNAPNRKKKFKKKILLSISGDRQSAKMYSLFLRIIVVYFGAKRLEVGNCHFLPVRSYRNWTLFWNAWISYNRLWFISIRDAFYVWVYLVAMEFLKKFWNLIRLFIISTGL